MTAVLPPRQRNWPGILGGLIAFLALTIATCIPAWGGIDINLGHIARNWRNGVDRLAQMFTPDWSILPRTWEPLLETLAMAVVGAAISAVIALPLSLWAARPTNPSTPWRTLVRGIVNVIRAVPDLVYATILVAMLGVGSLPGIITLVLFDVGIVVKLVSEAIDSADDSYMEAGRAAGGTQNQILPRTWEPLLETLAMAVVGAAISAVIALPLSLWAARPTNPSTPWRTLVRGIVNVIRAVPDLVYATILVAMLGVGSLPGIITLVLFDVGIVVKLVSEAIDSADDSYMEAGRAAGGTQNQINRVTALPQTWPAFASQVIYSLELNVRISAVLGLVGAGGIGLLIDEVRGFYRYDALSAIVLELLVVVIALEVVSVNLRKRLR